MLNFNLHFPFPSFFLLDRCLFCLNLTFLVEACFLSFFLARYRFFFFLDRFLDGEHVFFLFSFFLDRLLGQKRVFFFSYCLVFFYKFPPQQLRSSNRVFYFLTYFLTSSVIFINTLPQSSLLFSYLPLYYSLPPQTLPPLFKLTAHCATNAEMYEKCLEFHH